MRESHALLKLIPALIYRYRIEKVPQNMHGISSVIEYIIMEVSQNISIYTYSVILAYNGISILI